MAERVARVKIQAIVDGLQGFEQFTGAIKKLQGAIGPADSQLEKARQNIIAFGEANKQSTASIDAQINALKALRQQAGVGGEAFRLINRDINRLTVSMEEAGRATRRVSGILTTSIPAKTPDGIQKQINGLRQIAKEAEYMSDKYVAAVSRIRGLERLGGNMAGREGVLAGFNAANDQQLQAYGSRYLNNIDLPNTNAALAQRIQEVTDRLANLTRGSAEWRSAANELKRLTRESAEGFKFMGAGAQQAKQRLEEFRRTMQAAGSGFAEWSKNPTAITDTAAADAAIQKSIERNRRKRGILGANIYDAPLTRPEPPSELFRNIGGISNQTAANQAQLMGRSYREVANSIREVARTSDGSIGSLQRQREAWEQLRATISPLDKEYAEIERASRRAINNVDRQIGRRQIGSRGGPAQIGQGLGALAASGIFGGPEGLIGSSLGAGIGAFLAGPAGFATGSFIGGSVGAYASMGRQRASGIGDYVRDLNLAKVTLAQASASQEEYNRRLATARQIGADYSVTLKETIQGYSQVAVAAKANNLSLEQTESIYRGMVAAGVAFGKSQDDINAIITATVQVLSKGKLSAEELQGQIGERLPGAVAKFAQATGRSLPQLSKDLQAGQVDIAAFVKYAEAQLKDYDEIAKLIGASPEKAGARLQLALDAAAENFGGFFQRIGAGVQDSMTRLVSWFNENSEMLKRYVTFWWNMSRDVSSALKWLVGQVVAFRDSVIKIFKDTATFVPNQILGLFGTSVDDVFANTIGRYNNAVLDGFKSRLKSYTDNYTDLFPEFTPPKFGFGDEQKQETIENLEEADAKAKRDAERRAREEQQMREALARARTALDDAVHRNAMDLIRKRYEYELELTRKQRDNWVKAQTGAARTAAGIISGFFGEIEDLQSRLLDAQQNVASATQELKSANALAVATGAGGGSAASGSAAFPGGARTSRRRDPDAEATGWDIVMPGGRGAAVRTPIPLTITGTGFQGRGAGSTGKGYGNWITGEFQLGGKTYELLLGHFDKIDVAKGMQIPAGGSLGAQGITGRTFGTHVTTHVNPKGGASVGDAWKALEALTRAWETGTTIGGTRGPSGAAAAARRGIKADGSADVASASLTRMNEELKLTQEQIRKLTTDIGQGFILDFTDQLRQATAELEDQNWELKMRARLQAENMRPEFIEAEIQKAQKFREVTQQVSIAGEALKKLEEAGKGNTAEANALKAAIEALIILLPQFKEKIDELAQSQAAAADKAKSFMGQFTDVTKAAYADAMNLGKNFGSAFINAIDGMADALVEFTMTGKLNFADLARSIIADINRIILRWLVFNAVKGVLNAVSPGLGNTLFPTPNALGNAFDANGIVPFARGGIVTRPTLFPFADGGSFRAGIMGEAGPEAILPLRRGPNGKLGVQAQGGGGTTVNVSVDARGTSAQGDNSKGEQLGRVVAQAVQQELIRQKRPGGLLAAA